MSVQDLFDSMHDCSLPPYKCHSWQGDTLLFATDEDYILAVPVAPDDTRTTLADKLWDAYHERIEQEEYEAIEAEEIARYENPVLSAAERGFMFYLLY